MQEAECVGSRAIEERNEEADQCQWGEQVIHALQNAMVENSQELVHEHQSKVEEMQQEWDAENVRQQSELRALQAKLNAPPSCHQFAGSTQPPH